MMLSPKKEKAMLALLTSTSVKSAAKKAEIGEATLFRWLKTNSFKEAYREARRNALEQAILRLQQISVTAVDTLEVVMNDDMASASSRVSAARSTLDLTFKAFELEEIEERIDHLERELERRESQ
ncbi:hypothetical protein [Alkalihalobacillus sp. CinArs1]|uniref:hypothetical protein n=1 Tax=Alkalihalobacillus sp. CinArs1 TaxID=2995314 RepID=UPI0022DD585A|nr:hypothetical protein [Alkalihalobacillus sp. CinArs1]